MLVEMYSPAFIENDRVRPRIQFKEGLNVILGKDDGQNSIGKSSAMLAIDFVFGGSTYIKSDGVKHIGHHTIYFAFRFDGEPHYFARNTENADIIYLCDKEYNLTGTNWTKQEFVDWLKKQYKIDFPGLSFRTAISSFFRIYGKDNTDEHRPLRGIPGQDMEKSIAVLLALFNRYGDVEDARQRLAGEKKKLEVYKDARKYDFISNLVGGQKKFEENRETIKSLYEELSLLTTEAEKGYSEEDIEKSQLKTQFDSRRLLIETELQKKRRKLTLVEMSLEYGLYPTDADLQSLQEFFPQVNIRKLYEIEKFHQKLAGILDEQFVDEKMSLEKEIVQLETAIEELKFQIKELGYVGSMSKEFLDRHSEIKGKIDALQTQNDAFLKLKSLQESKADAEDFLKRSIEDILHEIETELNEKMKEFDATLYAESRKPPHIKFNSYNSYKFETPDDTGTGSNFKSMVIYDLSVLFTTALPAIAHDSLILKNISDGSVDGIMKIYETSKKQIFIAFDKQSAYTKDTQQILENNQVLKLSDNNCQLYGKGWNIEENK